jgi:hypothetical protein
MAGLCSSGIFLTQQAGFKIQGPDPFPSIALFLGFWADDVMSKTHIEGLTNQRAEHPFENRSLHRHHAPPPQIFGEHQVGVAQSQKLPWLALKDLLNEYPCQPLVDFGVIWKSLFWAVDEWGLEG